MTSSTSSFEDKKKWISDCSETPAATLSEFLKKTQMLTSLILQKVTKDYLDAILNDLKNTVTLQELYIISLNFKNNAVSSEDSQMRDVDSLPEIKSDAIIPLGLLTANIECFGLWNHAEPERGKFLTTSDWKNIASDMTRRRPLKKFDFQDNFFVDPNLLSDLQQKSLLGEALAKIVRNTEKFRVKVNIFPENIERLLYEGLKENQVLRELYIFVVDSDSSSISGEYIGEALIPNLTELSLVVNEISIPGGETLAEAIKDNTLLFHLNLRAHRRRGVNQGRFLSPIFKTLEKNTTLLSLDVSSHVIQNVGRELCDMLRLNKTLTKLSLNNTRINAIPDLILRFVIQNAIRHSALTFLDLSNNKIGDEVAEYIANLLPGNRTLTYLGLSVCGISKAGNELLLRSCQGNYLCFLIISDYARDIRYKPVVEVPDTKTLVEILQPNKMLISIGRLDKSHGEIKNDEVQSIFRRNYSNHLIARKNWSMAALVIAFIRANSKHPFATSIFSLLNSIINMASQIPHTDDNSNSYYIHFESNVKVPLNDPNKFIGSLFFRNHMESTGSDAPMPQAKNTKKRK